MNNILPRATVFTTGGIILVLELLASRMLAPYLGTSLVVWTSLLSGILLSLSVGYTLGGALADNKPKEKTLAYILFGSAALIGLLLILADPVLSLLAVMQGSIALKSLIAVLILFTPPSVVLAMATPYALRLALTKIKTSGHVAGQMYAIGTIGSITGSVLTGFVLIPHFPHHTILVMMMVVLTILGAILAGQKKKWFSLFFSMFVIGSSFVGIRSAEAIKDPTLLVDLESPYNRIQVMEYIDEHTGREIRALKTDRHSIQSFMYTDNPQEPGAEYLKFYRIAKHIRPEIDEALMLGGGAYSFAKDFLHLYPNARLDVVEIDPKMTQIAYSHFAVPETERIQSFHEDGRVFLNQNQTQYDAIFVDAFLSFVSVPHHLTTMEAAERMHASLDDDGIVLVNLAGAVRGTGSTFPRALWHTYSLVFDHAYLFAVDDPNDPKKAQNLLLVAIKGDKPLKEESAHPEYQHILDRKLSIKRTPDAILLRDAFAPVDQMVLPLLAEVR